MRALPSPLNPLNLLNLLNPAMQWLQRAPYFLFFRQKKVQKVFMNDSLLG